MMLNNKVLFLIACLRCCWCISGSAILESNATDPCTNKTDGKYCTRSSFEYMECRNHVASYVSCENNIYEPGNQTCVSPSEVDASNYCRLRPNGDYNWPWNCHKYVTCSNHYFYPFNCSTAELIFDPNSGRCEHPGEVECKEIEYSRNVTNPCASKVDGKYVTRDIYQYLQCTNHIASYVPCVRKIFDPKSRTCVDYSKVSEDNFCKGRPNGNYNDPWNCHQFITCSNGNLYVYNCSTPELVYDPKSDTCKHPGEAVCKQINDPCSLKDDGKYATRDVFQYMVCKQGHATYVSCGDNIYNPCSKTCVAPSSVTMKIFCKCRGNGNYMDPWDCHKYITCSNGYHYLFICSIAELVYDPSVDQCVHPEERECKQVKVEHIPSSKMKGGFINLLEYFGWGYSGKQMPWKPIE